MNKKHYNIYPSLLDSYTGYLRSDEIYQQYWGYSENPPMTVEEFRESQYQSLIDSINRVPFESVYADIGTVFNELVDCLILGKKSPKIEVEKVFVNGSVDDRAIALRAKYNERTFTFPLQMVTDFADKYRDAVPQMFVEGILETNRGAVRLYGYLDELMPVSVHDIKTTSSYHPWKFKHNAQHLVYPYCLHCMGVDIDTFSYDIAHIRSNAKKENSPKDIEVSLIEIHKEEYGFDLVRDAETLVHRCEGFIDFLEQNRDKITNGKVFGEE